MPTTFKRYAVDFDRDGRRDVVDSVADMVASTANNLKTDGWRRGETWGYEVVLPPNFNYMLADRSRQLTVQQWQVLGLTRAGNLPFPHASERAFLLLPAGARGPAFLMLQNFRVIMKYNPAEAYALAIGHLADRLRGGGPFVQGWPREERALTMRRASRTATTAGAPRLPDRRSRRPPRPAHPHRHPQFPGRQRTNSRRLCIEFGA